MTAILLDPVDELTRRRLLTGAGVLGLVTVVPGRAWGQEPGAFPVTVEHRFGSTAIAEEPQRVVAVGDSDPVLALGVVPVGLSTGTATTRSVSDRGPKTRSATPNRRCWPTTRKPSKFERIAALEPDLIIGMDTHMTEQPCGLLSRAAPRARRGVDRRGRGALAQARAQHPELERRDRDLRHGLGAQDPRKHCQARRDYGDDLSDEQMSLLEADVVVWNFYEPGGSLARAVMSPWRACCPAPWSEAAC